MADVFVGYTRSDKAIAEQVVEALEALGLTIYWDTNLPAGEVWNEALERELREAPCTSVLWSSSSENRHYVRKEADLALELATLVTASIEHVQQPPEYYTINCADLRDFKPDAAHDGWLSLLEGIGVKLKRPGLREYAFLRSQAETEALGWAEWATKYPDDPCVDEAWKKVAAGANRAATTWIAQAREVASGREDPETRITNVRAILNVEIQPAIQRVPQSRYRMV